VTDLRAHTRAGAAATPTLIYDGDCGFCTSAVRLVERRLRPRCTIEPWQVTDLRSMGIPCSRAASEVLWVTPSGEVHGGAQAVAKLLLHTGGLWRYVGALLTRPPVSWLASGAYTVIARNRGRLPGGTPACALPPEQRPGVT
jgi:predicted DCC family thiol-disulfide oxidoreductase YuxK